MIDAWRPTLRARLVRVLKDPEAARHAKALKSLEAAGLDPDRPLDSNSIASALQAHDTPPEARATIAWLVGQVREEALLPVLERMAASEEEPIVLWEVAKSLCALAGGRVQFRRRLSKGRTPEVRRISAFALGCLQDRESVDALCRRVNDREEGSQVRGQAAESLGYIADRSAFQTLAAAAVDRSPEVRFWAVFALGRLGDAEARPLLEQIAIQDTGFVEGWGSVAEEARAALLDLEDN